MIKTIQFTLNDNPVRIEVDDGRTLLWVLRTDLGLTGAKFGCGEGICGACTVLVDDRTVRSCQITVGSVAGKKITTIEGLSRNGRLHPIQKAFIKHDAMPEPEPRRNHCGDGRQSLPLRGPCANR